MHQLAKAIVDRVTAGISAGKQRAVRSRVALVASADVQGAIHDECLTESVRAARVGIHRRAGAGRPCSIGDGRRLLRAGIKQRAGRSGCGLDHLKSIGPPARFGRAGRATDSDEGRPAQRGEEADSQDGSAEPRQTTTDGHPFARSRHPPPFLRSIIAVEATRVNGATGPLANGPIGSVALSEWWRGLWPTTWWWPSSTSPSSPSRPWRR